MVKESESLGLTGVLATDHLAGWRRPSDPVLEATTALGTIAAVAERRVGSLVLQTTLRSPSYTADVAGTLAAICRAPPLIGLGVGDSRSRWESNRLGIVQPPLPERIALLKETIAAVRARTPDIEIWVGGWRPELRQLAARTGRRLECLGRRAGSLRGGCRPNQKNKSRRTHQLGRSPGHHPSC